MNDTPKVVPIGSSPRIKAGKIIEKVVDGKIVRCVDVDLLRPDERARYFSEAEAQATDDRELIARVAAALFDALEQFGSCDWLALQEGRIQIEGSFPQDEVARAIIASIEA